MKSKLKNKKQELNFWKSRFLGRTLGMTKRKRLAVGVITAIIAIGGIFVYFQTRVGATTYQWLQAAWTGGADTVNFPRHGVNQTGWDKFYSKDTTQVKTSSGDIEINSFSQKVIHQFDW